MILLAYLHMKNILIKSTLISPIIFPLWWSMSMREETRRVILFLILELQNLPLALQTYANLNLFYLWSDGDGLLILVFLGVTQSKNDSKKEWNELTVPTPVAVREQGWCEHGVKNLWPKDGETSNDHGQSHQRLPTSKLSWSKRSGSHHRCSTWKNLFWGISVHKFQYD